MKKTMIVTAIAMVLIFTNSHSVWAGPDKPFADMENIKTIRQQIEFVNDFSKQLPKEYRKNSSFEAMMVGIYLYVQKTKPSKTKGSVKLVGVNYEGRYPSRFYDLKVADKHLAFVVEENGTLMPYLHISCRQARDIFMNPYVIRAGEVLALSDQEGAIK
jgi:hypothetical protein